MKWLTFGVMRWLVVRSLFLALTGVVAGSGLLAPLAGWGQVPVAQAGEPQIGEPQIGEPPAGEQWCEYDPILVITTPKGNRVPVFYLTGAQGLQHSAATQLAAVSYTARPSSQGTWVDVTVTVPDDVFATSYPTRVTVSSGPWGTLKVHGKDGGASGKPMRVSFHLDAE